jgi:hypothetical protein
MQTIHVEDLEKDEQIELQIHEADFFQIILKRYPDFEMKLDTKGRNNFTLKEGESITILLTKKSAQDLMDKIEACL